MTPDISIIIPAYNAAAVIGDAVRACAAQNLESGSFEIIVVDDGSTDETALIAESAGARVLRQANAGPARARNAGAETTAGSFLLFTDADCVPPADWAQHLVAACNTPGVGASGGSYTLRNDRSLLARLIHADIMHRHRRMSEDALFLGSYNLCVRREAFSAVGGFDISYPGANVEDVDFSYRLLRAGWKLKFHKDITVAHCHEELLERFLRQQFQRAYWRVRLYRRHPGRLGGDGYTGGLDFIQAFATGAIWVSLTGGVASAAANMNGHILLFTKFAGISAAFALLLYLFVSLSPTLFAVKSLKRADALLWLPINFCRNTAWIIGVIWGLIALPFQKRKAS